MLIVRRDDGFFRFIEQKLDRDDPHHVGRPPVWGVAHYQSGIYETIDGAEAGARAFTKWFATENPSDSN